MLLLLWEAQEGCISWGQLWPILARPGHNSEIQHHVRLAGPALAHRGWCFAGSQDGRLSPLRAPPSLVY